MSVSMNSSMLPLPANALQRFDRSHVPVEQTPEAAKELESLFISLMLKEMRKADSGEGLFPGDSSDTLGGMFDQYLSDFIAESGGIGIADSIDFAL